MNESTTLPIAPCRISVNSTDPDILRFVELFTNGINAWIEAGQIIARRIDAEPNFLEKFAEACPDIPTEVIVRFEQIGRREVYPNLLVVEAPAVDRLLKLPYELQVKYFNEPVELLIKNDRQWETLRVDVRNLTHDQAQQVFTKDGVRSAAAQRAYIENKIAKAQQPVENEKAYHITGKKCRITRPVELTAKELTFILSQMDV